MICVAVTCLKCKYSDGVTAEFLHVGYTEPFPWQLAGDTDGQRIRATAGLQSSAEPRSPAQR